MVFSDITIAENGLHYDVKTEEVALYGPTPKPRLEGFRSSVDDGIVPTGRHPCSVDSNCTIYKF